MKAPSDQQEKALADIAATLQATMPPRENPRINTSIDSVYASGPLSIGPPLKIRTQPLTKLLRRCILGTSVSVRSCHRRILKLPMIGSLRKNGFRRLSSCTIV
jgi:hypothetical protein